MYIFFGKIKYFLGIYFFFKFLKEGGFGMKEDLEGGKGFGKKT